MDSSWERLTRSILRCHPARDLVKLWRDVNLAVDEEAQDHFVERVLHHPLHVQYPLSPFYITHVLKTLIADTDVSHGPLSERLQEEYSRVLHKLHDPNTFAHMHFLLDRDRHVSVRYNDRRNELGLRLWPASFRLADLILRWTDGPISLRLCRYDVSAKPSTDVEDVRHRVIPQLCDLDGMLEIGAGVGLPSLIAAKYGRMKWLHVTDYLPSIVSNLRVTFAELNGISLFNADAQRSRMTDSDANGADVVTCGVRTLSSRSDVSRDQPFRSSSDSVAASEWSDPGDSSPPSMMFENDDEETVCPAGVSYDDGQQHFSAVVETPDLHPTVLVKQASLCHETTPSTEAGQTTTSCDTHEKDTARVTSRPTLDSDPLQSSGTLQGQHVKISFLDCADPNFRPERFTVTATGGIVDVILAADIIYDEALTCVFLKALHTLLKHTASLNHSTWVLLSIARRSDAVFSHFLREAYRLGLQLYQLEEEETQPLPTAFLFREGLLHHTDVQDVILFWVELALSPQSSDDQ